MTNSLPHIRPPMEKQNSLSLTQGRKSAEADTFAAMLHKETKGAPDPAQPAAASPGTEKTTPQKDAATSEKSTDAPATAQTTARMDLPGIPLHGRGVTPFHRSALAGRSPSEVMQGQLFSNASLDIKQTQTLEGLMQTLGNGGDSPLASAQNFNIARQLPGLSLSMRDQNVIRELSSDDYVRTHNPSDAASARAKRRTARKRQGRHAAYGNEEIGSLSARFESGKAGISAIGYDSKGGIHSQHIIDLDRSIHPDTDGITFIFRINEDIAALFFHRVIDKLFQKGLSAVFVLGIGKRIALGVTDHNGNFRFPAFPAFPEKTKKEVPCILPQITVSDCEGPQKKSEKIVIFPQAAVPFPQFFIPDFQRIQSAEKPGKQKNQFHWSESHFPFPFPEILIVTQ